MKIPKKISPDNLIATIVQVLFESPISSELFLGTFNSLFSDSLKFVAASPKKTEIIPKIGELLLEPIEKGFFLDKEEKIKVEVTGNSLGFNLYKSYVGWEKYFALIGSIIGKLFAAGYIKEINRIGVRYISQFAKVNLFDSLNINLSIQLPNNDLNSAQIRTEFNEDAFRVILNLINRINQVNGELRKNLNVSIVDIDVIQEKIKLDNSKIVLETIANCHQKQKSIFFSLLKPEFLETLNPEY